MAGLNLLLTRVLGVLVSTSGMPYAGAGDWNMDACIPGLLNFVHSITGFIAAPTDCTCIAGNGSIYDFFVFSNLFQGHVGVPWINTSCGTTPHHPVFVNVVGVRKGSSVLTRRNWKPFDKEPPAEQGTWTDDTSWTWEVGTPPTELRSSYKQWIEAAEQA